MQRIAFCMDRKNGDGCVAAFLGQILKTAGYTTACLVGTGKKREHLRISCKAVSRKIWESLGEEPTQASTKKKLELLEQKNPQILFTMSTEKGYGAYELAEMVRGFQPNVTAVDSPEEALEIARLFAGEGQTTTSEMPLLLIVCPRELQEKMRKVISDWKMPHSWPHQKL